MPGLRLVLPTKISEVYSLPAIASRNRSISASSKALAPFTDGTSKEPQRSELDAENLLARLTEAPVYPFQSAVLFTESHDFHYAENRKGNARVYRAKASMKGVKQDHNRAKNYVLDAKRPYLKGLGVTSDKGVVIKKQYGKFRQIANATGSRTPD